MFTPTHSLSDNLDPGAGCQNQREVPDRTRAALPPRAFFLDSATLDQLLFFSFFLNSRPNAHFPVLAELLAAAGRRRLPGTWFREHRPNWSGQSVLWLFLPGLAQVCMRVCVRDPPCSPATQVGGKQLQAPAWQSGQMGGAELI